MYGLGENRHGGPEAPRTVEQGPDSAIWLVLDAPSSVHGKVIKDQGVLVVAPFAQPSDSEPAGTVAPAPSSQRADGAAAPTSGEVTDSRERTIVAVVTGASRGIGLEVCRQLAKRRVRVVLTARNADARRSARERLAAEGAHVEDYPLEVSDPRSVYRLRDWLEQTYGRLDVLVNNAAIVAEQDAGVLDLDIDVLRQTMEVNCYGPLHICQTLMPLLRKSPGGRIINVSSASGSLTLMERDHAGYRMSKALLNAVTVLLAAEFEDTTIAVNAMCPGWVKTDLGGADAPRSIEQGADTVVWLALEASPSLRGKFFHDRVANVPW